MIKKFISIFVAFAVSIIGLSVLFSSCSSDDTDVYAEETAATTEQTSNDESIITSDSDKSELFTSEISTVTSALAEKTTSKTTENQSTTKKTFTSTQKTSTTQKPSTTKKTTTTKRTTTESEDIPDTNMVWISEHGKRYHSSPSCSNMKNPSHVSRSTAESMGLTPCAKCW